MPTLGPCRWRCLHGAYLRLGSPEGDLVIAHTVIYLACAPKSNAVYSAFNEAMATVQKGASL